MYKYNFIQVEPSKVVEQDSFTSNDSALLESFQVNSSYNQSKDFIELHYYTLDGRLLKSFENYTNIQTSQDSETSNQQNFSTILLRTEDDLKVGGYEAGDVYLYYNFLTDPYSKDKSKIPFFIEEISPDRLEVRLLTTKLTNELIVEYTKELKDYIAKSDSSTLLLNLNSNRHLLSTNIDTLPYKEGSSVVIRLYNPLPDDITVKNQLFINRAVSNPIAYLAEAELVEEEKKREYLKGPNFNIYEGKTTSSPTQYFNIEDIFNYPVTNTYFEVKSLYEEKGIQLSIDYSDYDNFINFSSAEERLRNFKYKFDLIQSYESQSNNISNINSFSTGSTEYFDGLINNIISNFDHYDRFLYFESSSYSWPKSGTTKPYTLLTGSATGSWYSSQLSSASFYDSTNANLLTNTVPEFLREDVNNIKYTTFIHMIAQHFDNLWIYAKGVTDKYDADNRLNSGISKQLIEDALKNFGVRLYNSNRSSQELFRMFTGESYNTGSESYVDEVISGSNQVVSEEDYRRQIYKRLYHNLPLLLKSKGTERGARALLSSFGIPSFYSSGSHAGINIIRQGGTNTQSYNLGNFTSISSSLDKIRLDDTGSITGTTLSQYVSIEKRDQKYSKDTNKIQIGYSPSEFLNEYIIASASLDGFNIDSILGDPDTAYSSSYSGLKAKAIEYLTPTTSSRYNLKDFTRILKFYDNILFKTVNDFTPARDSLDTGIIIKPHLLDRSKAKQVKPSYQRHNDFSSSISIQTTTGSEGGAFGSRNQYSASYVEYFMTSGGLASSEFHSHEQAKFDGEFSGSYLKVANGELNDENTFKYFRGVNLLYAYDFINGDADCEIIWGEYTPSTPGPTPTPSVTPTITPTISITPTITPTISITPTITPTPGASSTPTPTPTSTVTPTITPTPSTSPPFVQQWSDFYIGSSQTNQTDACADTTLSTRLYFTSSVGDFGDYVTNFSSLTTLEKRVYTDDALTSPFNGATNWYGADQTGLDTSYALLIQTNGDVGVVYDCTPAASPTPTPSRVFLQLRNDGSSYPNGGFNTSTDACTSGVASIVAFGYVEAADSTQPLALNTQVYRDSTGSTVFDGGDKYWLSEDQTYAYRIGANGLVSQAISCASPTPTPTPTPSTTPISTVTISLTALGTESGTWPEYQVTIDITGAKSTTRTLQQTGSATVVDTFDLFTTGVYDGTGTITISRTQPDATVIDGADLSVSQLNGYTTSPTSKTFTNGQTVTSESFTVSGFGFGNEIDITITEG